MYHSRLNRTGRTDWSANKELKSGSLALPLAPRYERRQHSFLYCIAKWYHNRGKSIPLSRKYPAKLTPGVRSDKISRSPNAIREEDAMGKGIISGNISETRIYL